MLLGGLYGAREGMMFCGLTVGLAIRDLSRVISASVRQASAGQPKAATYNIADKSSYGALLSLAECLYRGPKTSMGVYMSLIWRSLGAVVVVLLFVCIIGYLEFRIAMLELGLNLTWELVPLSATTPATAYVEILALFVVFGLVAWLFLTRRPSLSGPSGVPPLVGGVALIAVTGWQMATVTHEVVMPVELNEPAQEVGWGQTIEAGALSSATIGMTALLLVVAILRFVSARNTTAVPASSSINS